jgi:hypothetical protein
VRLHFDCATEKTGASQRASGEQLNMKVIRLRYRDQADAIDRVLDLARPLRDKVESKAEEVLTLWIASDGVIEGIAPPPRCKYDAPRQSGLDGPQPQRMNGRPGR